MFNYRDEVYNDNSPDKGTAELLIRKQRNGPIGDVKLAFLKEFTHFAKLDRHTEQVPYDLPEEEVPF